MQEYALDAAHLDDEGILRDERVAPQRLRRRRGHVPPPERLLEASEARGLPCVCHAEPSRAEGLCMGGAGFVIRGVSWSSCNVLTMLEGFAFLVEHLYVRLARMRSERTRRNDAPHQRDAPRCWGTRSGTPRKKWTPRCPRCFRIFRAPRTNCQRSGLSELQTRRSARPPSDPPSAPASTVVYRSMSLRGWPELPRKTRSPIFAS